MFIQNVSYGDVEEGNHERSNNCILIQITDQGYGFPIPKFNFKRKYKFEFSDVESKRDFLDIEIKDEQAESIVNILKEALINKEDVVVHCAAGIRRSGAVAEIGSILGFEDKKMKKDPNKLVFSKLKSYI